MTAQRGSTLLIKDMTHNPFSLATRNMDSKLQTIHSITRSRFSQWLVQQLVLFFHLGFFVMKEKKYIFKCFRTSYKISVTFPSHFLCFNSLDDETGNSHHIFSLYRSFLVNIDINCQWKPWGQSGWIDTFIYHPSDAREQQNYKCRMKS